MRGKQCHKSFPFCVHFVTNETNRVQDSYPPFPDLTRHFKPPGMVLVCSPHGTHAHTPLSPLVTSMQSQITVWQLENVDVLIQLSFCHKIFPWDFDKPSSDRFLCFLSLSQAVPQAAAGVTQPTNSQELMAAIFVLKESFKNPQRAANCSYW